MFIGTHSATGPADSEPMKEHGAPSCDRTVQEFEAFPPRCQRCDKHLKYGVKNKSISISLISIYDKFNDFGVNPSTEMVLINVTNDILFRQWTL